MQFRLYTISHGDSLLQVQWSKFHEHGVVGWPEILAVQEYEVHLGRDQKQPDIRYIIALNRPEAISAPICNLVNTSEPAPNTTAPSLRQKLASTSLIVIVLLRNVPLHSLRNVGRAKLLLFFKSFHFNLLNC